MWSSAGLALILLVGLNASVPQVPGSMSPGTAARPPRREVHSEFSDRGERVVIRATTRRAAGATVRRLGGGGQPAMAHASALAIVVAPTAAVNGSSVMVPRNAIWETPYAPRAPPGPTKTSIHAG